MKVFLTGAAGFIGFHTARRFLARGDHVFGVDNLNSYYPVQLKQDRLDILAVHKGFTFLKADIARADAFEQAGRELADADVIVHLAAQAGVRYSSENPYAYVDSNVTGQVAVFEAARRFGKPVVYASSSSVYGAAEKAPFAESARADMPVSIYAATKRAGELLAHAYRESGGVRSTGLRFFTVYGRYGRPDMAPWIFTEGILRGTPISVFNDGEMERDFTHVDDIAAGVVAAADRILKHPAETEPLYNLGNNSPEKLLDFIATIETATGRKAVTKMLPKPPGDVTLTHADIKLAIRDLGFRPRIRLGDGMADFVAWFRSYHGIA